MRDVTRLRDRLGAMEIRYWIEKLTRSELNAKGHRRGRCSAGDTIERNLSGLTQATVRASSCGRAAADSWLA
jgi:hypothetical protein